MTGPARLLGRAVALATALAAFSVEAAGADTVAGQVDAAHTGVTASAVAPPLTERWRRTLDPSVPIDHTVRFPLVAGGRVFVSVQSGSDAPVVHALDAATGATKWTRTLGGFLRGAAYGDGRVIVTTSTGLYALDAATGAVAWTRALDAYPYNGAVVAAGVAYVGRQTGVDAVRISDGGLVWSRTGIDGGQGLAVDDTRVYVNAVTAALALRRSDGAVLWRYAPPMYTEFQDAEPAVRDGRVHVPGVPQGAVLDAASGALLRRPWMHRALAVDGTRSYVLDGEPGEDGEVLHALAVNDGASRWEFAAEEGITTFPLVSGETVYAMGIRGALYGLDRTTGRLTWCTDTDTVNYAGRQVSLAAGEGLLVLSIGGEVVALEHGGAAGCDYYGASVPGYHGSGSDRTAARAAAAAPAGFEPNHGQFPATVRYAARGADHTLLVRPDGATLAVGGAQVELRLHGGRAARGVRAAGRLPGVVNDYRGSDPAAWRTGLSLFRRVRLREVRPGVDLVLRRGGADHFEYDLVLHPGAPARRLALDFDGGDRPRLGPDGGLLIGTSAGVLHQPAPVAYQRVGGRRVRVAARFRPRPDGSVAIALGRYDRRREVVVDPVLEWSSFLGGGLDDVATAITTDADGFVYVAGRTVSRDLPLTGPFDGWDERNAICEDKKCGDAFVAKYRPGGASLVHLTYLSGRREDRAEAIVADADGNAYMTGSTMSPNFPTRNALQSDWRCGDLYGDAFVAKLSPDGSQLDYGTYVGSCLGWLGEAGRGIAVDAQGRAVIAGRTDSHDFPTTAGAADRTCGPANDPCQDAFVAKLSADGSRFEWSTLFGGDGSDEEANAVRLDAQGRPVIAGTAYGFTTTDFPATPGAYDESIDPAFSEVFAARLAADGSRVEWATAFGGRDWDTGSALALDGQGDVHIAGRTESGDFPTTPGSFDRVCNDVYEEYSCTNHSDAFALELSADGSRLLASTYLGGAGSEDASGLALDGSGRAYLTGATASSERTFPLVDPFQAQPRSQNDFCASLSDCSDAYVLRLSADASHVEYSSFLGGRSHDAGKAIALDGEDAWVAGFTHSTDLPTTSGTPQATAPGGDCGFFRDSFEYGPCTDGFVSRVGSQRPPVTPTPTPTPSPSPGPTTTPGPTPGGSATPPPATPGGTPAQAVVAPPPLRAARRITVRRTARGVRGRVLTGTRSCRRAVPLRLERRAAGRWRRVAARRTRADGRFTVRARLRARRYRVRLPVVVRDGGGVRCGAAVRRVPSR